jgi:hypothetical protein
MRKEIIDKLFNKATVDPHVLHLCSFLIKDVIIAIKENKNEKTNGNISDLFSEHLKYGTYLVFRNEIKNQEHILISHVSEEILRNRVSASIMLDNVIEDVSEHISTKEINKDSIFMINDLRPEISFATSLLETSLDRYNLYNKDKSFFVGKKGITTFLLSMFIDEYIVEMPLSIIGKKIKNNEMPNYDYIMGEYFYGIAYSDAYFISDADSGNMLSIYSAKYGIITELKNGDTIKKLISEDKLPTMIDDLIHNVIKSKNNTSLQSTENGNKILH